MESTSHESGASRTARRAAGSCPDRRRPEDPSARDRDRRALTVPPLGRVVVKPDAALGKIAEAERGARGQDDHGTADPVGALSQRMGVRIPVVEIADDGHCPSGLPGRQHERHPNGAAARRLGYLDQRIAPSPLLLRSSRPPGFSTHVWQPCPACYTFVNELTRARAAGSAGLHVRLRVPGNPHPDPVYRGRRGNVKRLPVRVPPVQVRDDLGYRDDAEAGATRLDDPDPVRAGAIHVAELVAFHPVGDATLRLAGRADDAGADVLVEPLAAPERAVLGHAENPYMTARSVVDVEPVVAGREAQPVRLAEVVHEQLQLTGRQDPVQALEIEVLVALDAVHRHPTVDGV